MPTPGYNLYNYLEQLVYELTGASKSTSSLHWSDSQLVRNLNTAQSRIQEALDFLEDETPVDLVSGTSSYPVPEGVQGAQIRQLRIDKETTTGTHKVNRRTLEYMRNEHDLDNIGSTAQGTPVDWSLDPTDATRFILRPVPNYTRASAIRISHIIRPTVFQRIFRPDKLSTPTTLSVANGSTICTASAAVNAALIAANDELGVIPTTLFDLQTVTNDSPFIWYKIDSVSGTAIVLTQAYQGETDTAASWVSSQVSDLERAFPGILQWAPVYLAAADMVRRDDVSHSQILREEANRILAQFQPDASATVHRINRPAAFTSQFRRR